MVLPGSDHGRAGELLAEAADHLSLGTPAELASAVTRSHLADGRTLGWTGPVPDGWAWVIDAEDAARRPPSVMIERFGERLFWQRWTQSECACKLADVPMLAWWPQHGLGMPRDFGGVFRTLAFRREGLDLVVTVAGCLT